MAYTQSDGRVTLIDNTHGDHFYEVEINTGIAKRMYLHFNTPEIPNYGSIYDRISKVSGWYINEKEEKTTLLGVLWSQNKLTLYAPKQKTKCGNYTLVAFGHDSVSIYEGKNIIEISEKFNLTANDGLQIKNGRTSRVQGINFNDKSIERTILVKIQNGNRDIHTINLHELILKELGTSKPALIGMNGFAETEVTLLEFTFTDDGVNVLFEIIEHGSCNTDRRSMMYVTINNMYAIENYGIFEVENCRKYYSSHEEKENIVSVISLDADIDSKNPETYLGSFKIIESKIEIIKQWQ